jgi:hypothetical protein
LSVSHLIFAYIAFPLGITGAVLIFCALSQSLQNGLHGRDELVMKAGALLIMLADFAWFTSAFLAHHWAEAASDFICMLVIAAVYFCKRPPRWRKVKKLLGAKAKALRAKLAEKIRDSRDRARELPRRRLPVPVPG